MNLRKLEADKNNPDFTSLEYHDFFYCYNHPTNNPGMYHATRSKKAFEPIFKSILEQSLAIYLLQESGKTVGICRLIQGKGPHAHTAEIASVAIHPDKHGKGYGKKLLELLMVEAHKDYLKEITRYELSYESDNSVTCGAKFYNKQGFIDEVLIPDFFRSNHKQVKLPQDSCFQDCEDNRFFKHPWLTTGRYAAKMRETPSQHYHPAKSADLKINPSAAEHKVSYGFQLANIKNFAAVTQLYRDDIWTEWGYEESISKLHSIKEALTKNCVFVVYNQQREIVCSCAVEAGPLAIEHMALISQIAVKPGCEDSVKILLEGIVSYYQQHHVEIKNFDLTLPDNNQRQSLFTAIQNAGFSHRGIWQCRYKTPNEEYWDEHSFGRIVFNLDDAIRLCEQRLASEKHYTECKEKNPFTIPLPINLLEEMKSNLFKLKTMSLSAEEERFIYQIVRITCTQDLVSPLERVDQLSILKAPVPPIVGKLPLYDIVNASFNFFSKYSTPSLASQSFFTHQQPEAKEDFLNNSSKLTP